MREETVTLFNLSNAQKIKALHYLCPEKHKETPRTQQAVNDPISLNNIYCVCLTKELQLQGFGLQNVVVSVMQR